MINPAELQLEIDQAATRLKLLNRETLESYQREAEWNAKRVPPVAAPEPVSKQALSPQELYLARQTDATVWDSYIEEVAAQWS